MAAVWCVCLCSPCPPDEGARHSDEYGHDEPARVVSRQNQFAQSPGYEPDYDPRNDTHLLVAPFVWCSLRLVYDPPTGAAQDTCPPRTSTNLLRPPPFGEDVPEDFEAVGCARMLFSVGLRMTLDTDERSSTSVATAPVEARAWTVAASGGTGILMAALLGEHFSGSCAV